VVDENKWEELAKAQGKSLVFLTNSPVVGAFKRGVNISCFVSPLTNFGAIASLKERKLYPPLGLASFA